MGVGGEEGGGGGDEEERVVMVWYLHLNEDELFYFIRLLPSSWP